MSNQRTRVIHTLNGPVELPRTRETRKVKRTNQSYCIIDTLGGTKTTRAKRDLLEEATMRRLDIVKKCDDVIEAKTLSVEEKWRVKMALAEERGEIISLD